MFAQHSPVLRQCFSRYMSLWHTRVTRVYHFSSTSISMGRGWTARDEAELRMMHKEGRSALFIADALGRTERAVRKRYSNLGLTSKRVSWSKADAIRLRDARDQGLSWAEIHAMFPHIPFHMLQHRYHNSTGLGGPGTRKPWTVEEDSLLLKLVEDSQLSWVKAAEHFPGRGKSSLRTRYETLRTRPQRNAVKNDRAWTMEESNRLSALMSAGHTIKEMTALLDRTYNSVYARARRTVLLPRREWLASDLVKLHKLHSPGCNIEDMAKLLKRSPDSVRSKLLKEGLRYVPKTAEI